MFCMVHTLQLCAWPFLSFGNLCLCWLLCQPGQLDSLCRSLESCMRSSLTLLSRSSRLECLSPAVVLASKVHSSLLLVNVQAEIDNDVVEIIAIQVSVILRQLHATRREKLVSMSSSVCFLWSSVQKEVASLHARLQNLFRLHSTAPRDFFSLFTLDTFTEVVFPFFLRSSHASVRSCG